MKDRKKHRGMKAEIRAYKKRIRYIAISITVAIITISIFLIYSYLNPSQNQTTSQTLQLKAVIVDQGSLSPAAGPNPVFIETATNTLKKAGFTVDYYPGEEVTVDFYRKLPSCGYSLIVLRVHATEYGSLFTSELYSTNKYIYEQLNEQVKRVAFTYEDFLIEGRPTYFGIPPAFVPTMRERFQNAVIIMTGCSGLKTTDMARALVQKGAKVYISWNGLISASHADHATTQLLKHLITEKQTIKQAVTNTMKEVGPDPADGSVLLYYPDTLVDNYVIPNTTSNLKLNDADNADLFLVEGGWVMLAIKAQSIDVTKEPSEIYEREINTMKARGFHISEVVHLEPYDKAHAMILANKKQTKSIKN